MICCNVFKALIIIIKNIIIDGKGMTVSSVVTDGKELKYTHEYERLQMRMVYLQSNP